MIDPIPVHAGLAPADPGYGDLEVEPWPHIHVWADTAVGDDDPVIKVRLVRYKGWPIWVGDRESRDEVERWTRVVRSPSHLTRLLSLGRVTLGGRLEAAVEQLGDQWDELVAERQRVESAAAARRERPR